MSALLLLFRALPLLGQIAAIGAVALTLLASYGVWHHKIYSAGYARAIADIAAQDKRAIAAAQKGRSVYRTCVDGGGTWDVATGKCGRT